MTSPTAALPALADLQWSLDGLVMGPGTRFNVGTPEYGSPGADTQDQPRSGEDGMRQGRDRRSGRLITLPLNAWGNVDTPLAVQSVDAGDALDELEGAWDAEHVRTVPGAYSVLRWRRGQTVRRVYGRSNPILTDSRMDYLGNIGATATFRTMDPRYYDDAEQAASVTLVPAPTGGLIGPLIGPIYATGTGVGQRGLTIGGTRPTWLITVVRGPISRPVVEIVGKWSYELDLTLGTGEVVVVDPTPWSRSVRSDQGANRSGRLVAGSRPLSAMLLEPGEHAVVLRGADVTGTARVDLFWRQCYASYIGGR